MLVSHILQEANDFFHVVDNVLHVSDEQFKSMPTAKVSNIVTSVETELDNVDDIMLFVMDNIIVIKVLINGTQFERGVSVSLPSDGSNALSKSFLNKQPTVENFLSKTTEENSDVAIWIPTELASKAEEYGNEKSVIIGNLLIHLSISTIN